MPKITPKQGDIYIINLNPTKGHEQKGVRPVVIISGNSFHVSGVCWVCPLTTQIKNYFGNIICNPNRENNLSKQSEVLLGQIRTIDQLRLEKKIGNISDDELKTLLNNINILTENF